MIDFLLYPIALGLVKLLQALPLTWVARIGRTGGALAYWLDARHRRVANRNLALSLGPDRPPAEIRALARENFRRLGENYACSVKTASMTLDELKPHLEVIGIKKMQIRDEPGAAGSLVMAIGHFGNFELFARAAQLASEYQPATTYRSLNSPRLDRLLLYLREKNGCLFFERRREGGALRAALGQKRLMLGLLADQHAGDHGVRLPFLGRECSTSKAPAVFALRYELPLHTAICFRTRLGYWRIEVGDAIPTSLDGQPRSIADIMLDVNRAFEEAVRRDPANWFWVHNRWKPLRKLVALEPERAVKTVDALKTEDAT
jgi:lauroyl/myristoyl acyltransferase